jgi:hypothetical protein
VEELTAEVDCSKAQAEYLSASVREIQTEAAGTQSAADDKVHDLEEQLKSQRDAHAETVELEAAAQEKVTSLEATLAEVVQEAERQHEIHEATKEEMGSLQEEMASLRQQLDTALAQLVATQIPTARPGQKLAGAVASNEVDDTPPREAADSPHNTTRRSPRVPQRNTTPNSRVSTGLRSPGRVSPGKARAGQRTQQPQDLETQLADLQRQATAHKRAREQAEDRASQLENELEAIESRQAHPLPSGTEHRRNAFDWTTYGIDEELDGEQLDEQVKIERLVNTTEQLRSHCQTLEVENASMRDLMAAFELSLEQHAQLIGHVNHKQKIRYTLQLKDTINRLLDELRRSRSRIFALENINEGEDAVGGLGASPEKKWMVSTGSVSRTTTTTLTRTTVAMAASPMHERPQATRRRSVH